jgi:hypothetical protein
MKTIANLLACACLAACGDNTAPEDPIDGGEMPVVDTPPVASPSPSLELFDFALAIDITPDGRTAALEDISTLEARVYFYDTVTGELTPKALIGDPTRAFATGISAGGRVSALHGEPIQAGLWTEATDWIDLGSPYLQGCDQDIGGAFDISADGSTAVGMLWNGCNPVAFRWTEPTGLVPLQVLGTETGRQPTNRATVISDDGKVVAGFAENGPIDRSAAVWHEDGTGFLLDEANLDAPSEVLSISADGKTLAGIRGYDGFVWTRGTGIVTLQRLETSLPSDSVFPNAIARNGELVLGGLGDPWFSVPTAFVWTAQDGMRPLADIVRASGIELADDVNLMNVMGASEDGLVLVGVCSVGDAQKTFVLRLPAGAL